MSAPDVVFALTGDVRRNSRAIRQLRALAGLGARVDVLTFGPPADDEAIAPGIRLRPIAPPAGGGPRFFAGVHRAVAEAAAAIPARVYHASDLYTLPAMAAAASAAGARLVYDARELYPYVAATVGRPWSRLLWKLVERRYIRRADAVFTVSDRIAAHLAQTYRIPEPTVLYNVPPRREVAAAGRLRALAGVAADRVVLLHQGQIRPDRGCERLVDAMAGVEHAVLVFLGDGPLRPVLAERAARGPLAGRVRFVDPVPPDALLPLTADADVGITLLEDSCLNHRYALPNKLFEYISAGLPVLASDLPEIRRVVAGYDVGRVVDPADPAALAAALQAMVDDEPARRRWAARGPVVLETFSWEKASQLFLRHYRELL